MVVGTPEYMAPEQAQGMTAVPASDLYAVGVIAFELLTGSAPFADAGSAAAVLVRKVNERAPSVRSRRPDLDRGLADWVDRLLDREPGRRPSSPQAVRESLEEAAESAIGVRWRRDALLPAGRPEPGPAPSPAVVPHRFASTRTLQSRAPLRRLVANALTRPGNVLVAGGVAIAGALITAWLLIAAVVVYLALAAITLFDEAEAARVAAGAAAPPR